MIDFQKADVEFESFEPSSGSWSEWLAGRRQPVVHLGVWAARAMNGHQTPTKLGGVVVHPAEVILGLRAWDDAYEGVDCFGEDPGEGPWVLFDLEKIIRMMLRQSGLALEILASPVAAAPDELADGLETGRIVNAAITVGILHHYADLVRSGRRRLARLGSEFDAAELLETVRAGLTGLELASGRFDVSLGRLLERRDDRELDDVVDELRSQAVLSNTAVDVLDHRFDRWLDSLDTAEGTPLPDEPADYDWLHEYLIERRFQFSEYRS